MLVFQSLFLFQISFFLVVFSIRVFPFEDKIDGVGCFLDFFFRDFFKVGFLVLGFREGFPNLGFLCGVLDWKGFRYEKR